MEGDLVSPGSVGLGVGSSVRLVGAFVGRAVLVTVGFFVGDSVVNVGASDGDQEAPGRVGLSEGELVA